jgi:hypothetical protein
MSATRLDMKTSISGYEFKTYIIIIYINVRILGTILPALVVITTKWFLQYMYVLHRHIEWFNKSVNFKLFGFLIFRYWASPDEGYSRNVSCVLNVISTFLLLYGYP